MALRNWDVMDWSPWRDLDRMRRRMSRLMGDVAGSVIGTPFPPVNVWADDDHAVVSVEVPGVPSEDLDISVENDVLTVRGSRTPESLEEGERYRRHERGHGVFARRVALPFAVEADQVKADYEHGVLRIELPRAEASKPRKIEITG